jgi:hypothetical protein
MSRLMASSKVSGCNETGFALPILSPSMANATEYFSLCTSAENASAAASSASCYHSREYIRIFPVIVPKRELGQIQRQIILAHLVIGTNHATLEQAPKAIKVLGVDIPAHVLFLAVGYHLVWTGFLIWKEFVQVRITACLVGSDQRDFIAHNLFNEILHCVLIGRFYHLANHVALAGDRANDRQFVATALNVGFLVPVAIGVLATDVGLVNFYFTKEAHGSPILHRSANAVAHIPSRSVLTATDLAVNLKRRHAFLALSHKIDDLEPSPKRVVGILENGMSDDREPIAVLSAAIGVLARPMKRSGLQGVYFFALAATRAFNAIGPAESHKIRFAVLFGLKTLHHGGKGQTRFGGQFFHRSLPPTGDNITIPRVGVKSDIIALAP